MEIEMETKPFDWNINLSNTIDKKKRKIIEKYYIKLHSILEYTHNPRNLRLKF